MNSDILIYKDVFDFEYIFDFVIKYNGNEISVFDGNMGEFTIGSAYVPVYQTLLMTVYAAYFAGRSIEKVKKVTK